MKFWEENGVFVVLGIYALLFGLAYFQVLPDGFFHYWYAEPCK